MKAKKLLKRVMESRSSKKVAKKIRKRNNKFLAGLYYANKPECNCCKELKHFGPTKEEWVAWLKNQIENSKTAIENVDVADPVSSITILSVEFDFWDEQKDPVKVLLSENVDMTKLVRNVRIVDSDVIVDVDPEPEQKEQ